MSWDRCFDLFVDALMTIFLPLVCLYHTSTENLFLNVSAKDASGIEKLADTLFIPFQYLCAGKQAIPIHEEWEFVQRFDYTHHFFPKTAAAVITVVPSLILGSVVKGTAYLFTSYSNRYASMHKSLHSFQTHSKNKNYQELGLTIVNPDEMTFLSSEGYQRRPGDENHLPEGKEALKAIIALLNENNIPWWVDCGTCLGTYRYGGVIPWDCDIDIAVLLPDFENVFHALKQLDPKKYIVQDWSSRDLPKSYIKVYVRHTNTLIDIYHFAIDEKNRQLHYVLSLETNIFFPEWWKIRERRFTAPVAFDDVFPLKKAIFDGIEVFVPNHTKKYLQRCYGKDISPAKLFDPETGMYEKDLSHPYWKSAYVH